jgi:hypothetical protein
LNGYFHFPYFNSLSEELVKAEGKGAIAAFSPSGMSLWSSPDLVDKHFKLQEHPSVRPTFQTLLG